LFDKGKLLYIAIMAIFLFCNSYFITLANGYLPAVKLNPLLNVSALLVGLFISVVFFKEKLKTVSVIGISLMIVGVIVINVL
jgi:small multidrug resistance pump